MMLEQPLLFVRNEFSNMINVFPDKRYPLRVYILDNIMGSSLDIFKASSQVKAYKGGVVFASKPFAKAWCDAAFIFE